jgi:hypothetical protein
MQKIGRESTMRSYIEIRVVFHISMQNDNDIAMDKSKFCRPTTLGAWPL